MMLFVVQSLVVRHCVCVRARVSSLLLSLATCVCLCLFVSRVLNAGCLTTSHSARVLTCSQSTCTRMCGSHSPLPRIAELQTVCRIFSKRAHAELVHNPTSAPAVYAGAPIPSHPSRRRLSLPAWRPPRRLYRPPQQLPVRLSTSPPPPFPPLLPQRNTDSVLFVSFRPVSSGETRLSLTVQQLLTRRLSLSLDASTCIPYCTVLYCNRVTATSNPLSAFSLLKT
jgi:hypothetical protein